MHIRGIHNNIKQLGMLIASFIIVIVLLESAGLVTWAERLEVGRSQELAVRVTTYIDNALKPLRIRKIRSIAIAKLAEHGWNESADERAGIAEANQPQSVLASAPFADNPPIQQASQAEASSVQKNIAPLTLTHNGNKLIPLPVATLAQPRVLALAGDSMMAVGLSVQLQRDLAKFKSIKIVRAFRSGTGLARPEVFNWASEYPKMLGKQTPNVIICAMGANDGQGFVENGKVLPFATPEWVEVYSARVEAYLNMLTRHGAVVLWVQLPPMKSAKFNKKINLINQIEKNIVARNPQAIWWNPAPYLADSNGNFRELAAVGKSQRISRIRSADGIHMLEAGASLFTPELVKWLNPANLKAQASN